MSGSEIQSASKSKNCISCTPVAAPLLWEDKLGGRSCFPDPLNSVLEFFLGILSAAGWQHFSVQLCREAGGERIIKRKKRFKEKK